MPKTMQKRETAVEAAMERLRQAAIEARGTPAAAEEGQKAVEQLNKLYAEDPEAFTEEDVRFANVLRGALGARLAAHERKVVHVKKAKRKGDKLDHCWRCATPVDERFADNCPTCSSKAYQWRVCPVCSACGCQRAGTVLI
jgi:hypothetical protein